MTSSLSFILGTGKKQKEEIKRFRFTLGHELVIVVLTLRGDGAAAVLTVEVPPESFRHRDGKEGQ